MKWTRLAYDCYHLKADCSRCVVPGYHLSEPCRMPQAVAELIKIRGTPLIIADQNGVRVCGRNEVAFKGRQGDVMDYLEHHPGVTLREIHDALGIPPYIISAALEKGYKLGLLWREKVRRFYDTGTSTTTHQWYFQEDSEGEMSQASDLS